MAAMNFPDAPSVGNTYTFNGRTYTWDGTSWLVSLGAASTGLQLIGKTVCVGGETSLSFSVLPQTFSELRIVIQGRDTSSGISDSNLRILFNNDTTAANYSSTEQIGSLTGTVFSNEPASSTAGGVIGFLPGISGNANAVGLTVIEIPNYTGTSFYKQAISNSYEEYGTSSLNHGVVIRSVTWRSTSAITSFKLTPGGTAFTAGVTVFVYGVGGTAGSGIVSTSFQEYSGSQFRWSLDYGADATPVNRPAFQSSSGTFTSINSIPPTGQTTSLVQVYNDPLMANCAYGDIRITSAVFSITTNTLGTGTQLPMAFTVGTEAMRIATSKNLMIGTTTDGMTAGGSLAISQDLAHRGTKVGFNNATPVTKPTVTGSKGANAALTSLLTALASLGLITDSTT